MLKCKIEKLQNNINSNKLGDIIEKKCLLQKQTVKKNYKQKTTTVDCLGRKIMRNVLGWNFKIQVFWKSIKEDSCGQIKIKKWGDKALYMRSNFLK